MFALMYSQSKINRKLNSLHLQKKSYNFSLLATLKAVGEHCLQLLNNSDAIITTRNLEQAKNSVTVTLW